MLSASSANCGSSASRAFWSDPPLPPRACALADEEARKEVREDGRSGVVGRESATGDRDRVREADVDGPRA